MIISFSYNFVLLRTVGLAFIIPLPYTIADGVLKMCLYFEGTFLSFTACSEVRHDASLLFEFLFTYVVRLSVLSKMAASPSSMDVPEGRWGPPDDQATDSIGGPPPADAGSVTDVPAEGGQPENSAFSRGGSAERNREKQVKVLRSLLVCCI